MIEQLWLFHCGLFRVPRPLFVEGERFEFVEMPFLAAVAHHSEMGPVLIDAPFGHEGPRNAGGLVGSFLEAVSVRFKSSWSIVPRLEQLGYRASEVQHVLMTHLHFDHTGGMKELAHATFHVSRREWNYACELRPFDALRQGYVLGDFRALRPRLELFDAPLGEVAEPGVDIFGDGSIEAVAMPGHAVGHSGYRMRMRDGRTIFFVGDAVFDLSQITNTRRPGPLQRAFAHNQEDAVRTIQSLRRYVEHSEEELVLIASHDIGWGKASASGTTQV